MTRNSRSDKTDASDTQVRFTTRRQWRQWLAKNHGKATGVWLVYVKAHAAERRLSYADAVEEALCFGWIDTTVRTIDEDHYMQRFTPRSNLRNWSKINLERFARMEAEGKMTEAGRAKKPPVVAPPAERAGANDPVPVFILDALRARPQARAFFEQLAPGYRRNYVRWITEAKRSETRLRRLELAIGKLERGDKLAF